MIVQSLRYRLTLLISGVALAVILLATTSTYVEMVHADIADATDRLRRVAPLVANLFGGSVPALRTMVGTVAGNPAVTAFLRDPRGRAEAARVALRPLLVPQAAIAGVELWDARGKRVLSEPVDLPVLSDASVGELSGLVRDSAAIVIGFISHDGGALHYSIIEKVTERGRLLGYLLQRRRLATSAQATVPFRDLIGADATMLVGNRRGDLWTDFTREAPVPPSSAMGQGAVARFQGHDGHDVLAMMAVIPGTPWSIVIELPIEPLLADVRAVLRQVVAGGVILLLLTAAAA